MMKSLYVTESITIRLPRTMPRTKRVSEVNRQISEWLKSFEKPFNYKTNMLRLKKYEKSDREYMYHYEVHRLVEEDEDG